ncbi:hypothetical protein BDV12DRAFT_201514 [Aspergillus spectabilis]
MSNSFRSQKRHFAAEPGGSEKAHAHKLARHDHNSDKGDNNEHDPLNGLTKPNPQTLPGWIQDSNCLPADARNSTRPMIPRPLESLPPHVARVKQSSKHTTSPPTRAPPSAPKQPSPSAQSPPHTAPPPRQVGVDQSRVSQKDTTNTTPPPPQALSGCASLVFRTQLESTGTPASQRSEPATSSAADRAGSETPIAALMDSLPPRLAEVPNYTKTPTKGTEPPSPQQTNPLPIAYQLPSTTEAFTEAQCFEGSLYILARFAQLRNEERDAITTKEEEISVLKEQVQNLESQLDLQHRRINAHDIRIQSLVDQTKSLETSGKEQLDVLNKQIEEMTSSQETKTEKIRVMMGRIDAKDKQITTQEKQIQTLEASGKKELCNFKKKIEEMVLERIEQDARITKLEWIISRFEMAFKGT